MSYKVIVIILSFSFAAMVQDHFVYTNGNQELYIKLDNGSNFLKWSETSTIKLRTRNIDPQNLSMSAPSLRLVKGATDDNPESLWHIKPEKGQIKNDTLKLNILVRDGEISGWRHQFKIVIKDSVK